MEAGRRNSASDGMGLYTPPSARRPPVDSSHESDASSGDHPEIFLTPTRAPASSAHTPTLHGDIQAPAMQPSISRHEETSMSTIPARSSSAHSVSNANGGQTITAASNISVVRNVATRASDPTTARVPASGLGVSPVANSSGGNRYADQAFTVTSSNAAVRSRNPGSQSTSNPIQRRLVAVGVQQERPVERLSSDRSVTRINGWGSIFSSPATRLPEVILPALAKASHLNLSQRSSSSTSTSTPALTRARNILYQCK